MKETMKVLKKNELNPVGPDRKAGRERREKMLGEAKIIIRDLRDPDGGYVQTVPDIPSLDKLVLDFRRGEAFLKSEEGWADFCRMEVRREGPGSEDKIIVFWPSWADDQAGEQVGKDLEPEPNPNPIWEQMIEDWIFGRDEDEA